MGFESFFFSKNKKKGKSRTGVEYFEEFESCIPDVFNIVTCKGFRTPIKEILDIAIPMLAGT